MPSSTSPISPFLRPKLPASRSSSRSTTSTISSVWTPATDYGDVEPSFLSINNQETCPAKSYLSTNTSYEQVKPQEEFRRIRQACPILSSTGCSKEFCQAGRVVHTDEPRVGRDRPVEEVQREAFAFLLECRQAGVITTDDALDARLQTVANEIDAGAVETTVLTEDGRKQTGLAGGNWTLERDELRYGVRAGWRNARKCIMRSQAMELELCDLRHVQTSKDMAEALIEGMTRAFNNGSIQPTAFMFPPREVGKRGPMVWNGQILAYAGYRQHDGTILGDPANADLTEAIVELGWTPPSKRFRTQWDLLPLVTMAEDDEPVFTELPEELKRVAQVEIRHPRYKQEFKELDLRWVAFPALSRLGFDIGGVQFTASPFIGWFMDAEIGVRNLADTFRYNVLPKIAKTLEAPGNPDWDIDDLPEYERLAVLSRAQAELNYAVNWSFIKSKVMMSDSLTASAKWTQFDDEHMREKGYRLPSDPYWLAPPIGSLIPVWHRGGAPNYQPKPLIARHVQDPIKAWQRERRANWKSCNQMQHATEVFPRLLEEKLVSLKRLSLQEAPENTIRIHFCSSGITAAKLAAKLYTRVTALAAESPHLGNVLKPQPLNQLDLSTLRSEDVILLVMSTTGRGEVPSNGAKFFKSQNGASVWTKSSFFAVFGNGDSTYGDTYNAAAVQANDVLKQADVHPMIGDPFDGDSSAENPPWSAFNTWWDRVHNALLAEDKTTAQQYATMEAPVKTVTRNFPTATLENVVSASNGIVKVTLNLGDEAYQEMDHVRVFPPNPSAQVSHALGALGVCPESQVQVGDISVSLLKYLTEYVDVDAPFKTLGWLSQLSSKAANVVASFQGLTVVGVLEALKSQNHDYESMLPQLCADMATITPRVFSAASSVSYNTADSQNEPHQSQGSKKLDLLLNVHPTGRFSHIFLSQAQAGATLRYSISPFPGRDILFPPNPDLQPPGPIIAITTGSGIGPVRSLLHHRIAGIQSGRRRQPGTSTPSSDATISLFAGYKAHDAAVIAEAIAPARECGGVLDLVELVPSNAEKVRVQDRLLMAAGGMREAVKAKLRHPQAVVFVCAGEAAAEGVCAALDVLVREIQDKSKSEAGFTDGVRAWMGERYVEEVFRC